MKEVSLLSALTSTWRSGWASVGLRWWVGRGCGLKRGFPNRLATCWTRGILLQPRSKTRAKNRWKTIHNHTFTHNHHCKHMMHARVKHVTTRQLLRWRHHLPADGTRIIEGLQLFFRSAWKPTKEEDSHFNLTLYQKINSSSEGLCSVRIMNGRWVRKRGEGGGGKWMEVKFSYFSCMCFTTRL